MDKRTFLGISLISVIILLVLLWSGNSQKKNAPKMAQYEQEQAAVSAVKDSIQFAEETTVVVTASQDSLSPLFPALNGTESISYLDNGLVKIGITSKGATPCYAQLYDYLDQQGQQVILFGQDEISLNFKIDIEHELERDLIETAMKEDRRLAGILGDSVIGNERYAAQLVNASFKNATFSERLWGNNMPALRSHLEAELRNGLIQGIHPRELARRFRRHYSGSVRDTERLMTTEMCRLQTAVQKESFERNGFTEYRFITAGDGHVCPVCEDLHGQHFKVSEMQPGDNAPPMHPSCRCSTAAWMDGDKYKRWIEALANGEEVRWDEFEADGPTQMSVADDLSEDTTQWPAPGEKITDKAFKEIRKYANEKGVQIAGVKKSDLDLELVRDAIDRVSEVLDKYNIREKLDHPFIMDFSHSLRSADFAESYPGTNHIIYFNKDAYRSLDALENEYKKREEKYFFVKGTDYRAIPYHEMGHIIADIFNINPLELALRLTGAENEKVLREELKSKLSEYASKIGGDEIIAECYSAVLSEIDNEFALKFVKECDKIILEKR